MSALKSTTSVIAKGDVTLDAASIPANTSAVQTVTLNGSLPGYPVKVWCEALEANLAISNEYCSALNTIKFTITNPTTGAVDPASHTYRIVQR